MFDHDTYNQIAAESKQYEMWLKKEKSKCLSLIDPVKKQQRWNELRGELSTGEIIDSPVY